MADFKLDTLTGDLDLGVNNAIGLQLHTNFGDEAAQRINQALNINIAEWFANSLAGIPLIENIEEGIGQGLRYFLGDKNPNTPQFIFSSLNKYITDLTIVTNFVSSSFTFDNKTRKFNYTFTVIVTSGEEISFPSLIIEI